ncbi:MAG: hypothetical protein KGD59_13365 [Candidatus Heimdallarchaeota archaeon]|nr:hypothetical protein [Candidatus Heimdallarchaeota archaeon]
MKALDYFTEISISYPVFGMLIWVTLGLNIGALIGLLASFGLTNIIFGGIIAGVVEEQRIQLREQYEASIPDEKPIDEFSGYSFTEQESITDDMIAKVEALIDVPRSVTVEWICSVTLYPIYIVEQIITEKLGYAIEDGEIIK